MSCAAGSVILGLLIGSIGGVHDSTVPAGPPSVAPHACAAGHGPNCPAHAPIPSAYPPNEGVRPQGPGCGHCQPGGQIVAPGPGYGWGYANGNPDGYGWVDYGSALPLGNDRTTDYFYRHYYGALPQQMFLSTYYNPYIQRGQRYIPYAGCGGAHQFGGMPMGSSRTPYLPDEEQGGANGPAGANVPVFSGRTEGPAQGVLNPNTEPPVNLDSDGR